MYVYKDNVSDLIIQNFNLERLDKIAPNEYRQCLSRIFLEKNYDSGKASNLTKH